MNNPNPALPAQAAAPGNNEHGQPTPSAVTPPVTPGQGGQSEGKVTITAEEFAQLQRNTARLQSFQKRATFTKKGAAGTNPNLDPADPANQRIAELETERDTANQRAVQAEIRGRVRDVLDKEQYKALPKSTRELILKNPSALSEADNAEEALLDVEDFVREQCAGLTLPNSQPSVPGNSPAGHETPKTVNPGSPAPATTAGLEDTSNLRGVALSRAVLRNKIKQSRGQKN